VKEDLSKTKKPSLKKLLVYMRPFLPALIASVVLAVYSASVTIAGPKRIEAITNTIMAGVVSGIDISRITQIAMILGALFISGSLCSYICHFILATVTQRVCYGLRADISSKINKLPLKYFDKESHGNVLSRVTNDIDNIGQALNQGVGMMVISFTLFVGAIIMMLITSPLLAVIAISTSLFGFAVMFLIITKSQKYFRAQQSALGEVNGHVEEIYSGSSTIKIYGAQDKAREKFTLANKKLWKSGWKAQFFSGMMMPVMGFIGNLGYVAVCVAGAILASSSNPAIKIEFGTIVAFLLYIRFFTQPLTQFAQGAQMLQSASASSERVFGFLKEEEMESETHKTETLAPESVKGFVEFSNVSFGYVENKPVIENLSFKATPGQKIAIVGQTGAGKTTIVNLLMRFYEVLSGEILIDGLPISSLKRETVHSLFCMVLQDSWLFEGTVKENVAYANKEATDEEIKNACKTAGVHRFIKTLSGGYNTMLTENTALSAGQKQLLTIARAILTDAPMLILDEATSSVDTRTEILVQTAMDKLTAGRTSFIIAHRLSTIKNADIILVLHNGGVAESGSHQELIKKNGFYSELYNSQFNI